MSSSTDTPAIFRSRKERRIRTGPSCRRRPTYLGSAAGFAPPATAGRQDSRLSTRASRQLSASRCPRPWSGSRRSPSPGRAAASRRLRSLPIGSAHLPEARARSSDLTEGGRAIQSEAKWRTLAHASSLARESKRSADGERFRDASRGRRVADHHVDLVSPSAKNERRGGTSSRVALEARSAHGSQLLERPATRLHAPASARRRLPADDHDDGTVWWDAISGYLALRRPCRCPGSSHDQAGARISHGAVAGSCDAMPARGHRQRYAVGPYRRVTPVRGRGQRHRHRA